MGMLEYINAIQQKFITQYGYPAGPNGCPQGVPDGEYPMEIDGKVDRVRITKGKISCCNWDDGQ